MSANPPPVWSDMGQVPYCGFCGKPMRLLYQTSYFCNCVEEAAKAASQKKAASEYAQSTLDFDSLWDDITPVHPDRCPHDAPYASGGSFWCRRCGKLLATP